MLQLNSGNPCAFRGTHVRPDFLRPRGACRGRRLQQARNSPRDALEALFLKDTAPGFEEERSAVQQGSTTFAHPPVDWSLYYIQILFVGRDHDDPRARLACAIFERISSWNGFGRAIYENNCDLLPSSSSSTSGSSSSSSSSSNSDSETPGAESPNSSSAQGSTSSEQTEPPAAGSSASSSASSSTQHRGGETPDGRNARPMSTSDLDSMASFLSRAHQLKLDTKVVARAPQLFEVDDLDSNHLVLCMDEGVREGVLDTVPPPYRKAYEEKVVVLTSFSSYESDATLAQRGGFALLPQQFSSLLLPGLAQAKQAKDVPVPMRQGDWMSSVQVLILSTACLTKYLMDAHPEDHWDDT